MLYDHHVPVLCKEALDLLDIKPDSICLDMTLGRAGHSSKILNLIPKGFLYATDKDQRALEYSTSALERIGSNFRLFHSPFSQIIPLLKQEGIDEVDRILFDIGVSSPQFDDPQRGFSYRYDAKLDMRMDLSQSLTAYDVVNTYSEEELRRIIFNYGEDLSASRIAHQIILERAQAPIETTFQLVEVIKKALPNFVLSKKGHPAKQTFQAIRYEVNNEEEELSQGLDSALDFLSLGGRLAIITFNSLEDRIVKEKFKSLSSHSNPNRNLPPLPEQQVSYKLITKKPVEPSQAEIDMNPRSKPAKLRVIERIRK